MKINKTVETYNTYAHIYDEEVIDFWQRFPRTVLMRFHAALPGRRVLNLGSGSGRDALLLRGLGLEVVCLDASSTMVAMTEGLGFESHLANFLDFTFHDNSFDGVWAYTSLIHITPQEAKKVLMRTHTMLKPEGALLFGAIEGQDEKMVERKTMPDMLRYFKFYEPDELKQLVTSCGYEFLSEETYQPHSSIYVNQLFRRA